MGSLRFFGMTAALSGFLSVAFGAFGAHFLKSRLDTYSLNVFKTGVEYQFYHTFALLLITLLLFQVPRNSSAIHLAGICFIFGIVIFSGSLYLLALTGIKTWGAVTPIGGIAFLVGWALLGYGINRSLN